MELEEVEIPGARGLARRRAQRIAEMGPKKHHNGVCSAVHDRETHAEIGKNSASDLEAGGRGLEGGGT